MGNLDNITTNQAAIIALFGAINYNVGNERPRYRIIGLTTEIRERLEFEARIPQE
jgi:hypothetical protein